MNPENLRKLFLFSMLLVIINSCHKDNYNPLTTDKLLITNAHTWFEHFASSMELLKSSDFNFKKIKAKPDWRFAYVGGQNNSKTVEVPLSTLGRFGIVSPERKAVFDETLDEKFMESSTSLIIQSDIGSGEIIGFLMTLVPDKDYLLSTDFKAFSSKYLSLQDNYSGYILYHNLDGSFSNGWKLKGGEVIGKINLIGPGKINIEMSSSSKSIAQCTDVYIIHWYQDCTTWITVAGSYVTVSESCGTPYTVVEYAYSICTNEESEGGGGGGSSPIYLPGGNTPLSDKIYNSTSSLTSSQKANLEVALSNFLNNNPLYSKIYNYFISKGICIRFYINSNINGAAAFNHTDNSIAFKSESYIDSQHLTEELVHCYQKLIYTTQFNPYVRNLEFEAKVLQDVSCQKYGTLCSYMGASFTSDASNNAYINWINQLAAGTLFDLCVFNDFCSTWTYPYPPNNYYSPTYIPSVILVNFPNTLEK